MSDEPGQTAASGRALVGGGLAWAFAVCALFLPTLLAEPIGRALGLSPMEQAYGLAVALTAGALGGIAGGVLGDLRGRRAASVVALALVGAGQLGTALASGPIGFLVARAVAGVGVGGVWACVQARLAESAPSGWRDRLAGCLEAGAPVGIAGALLLSHAAAQTGWRGAIGAVGAATLAAAAASLLVPESDPWKRARGQSLRAGINRLIAGDWKRRFYAALLLSTASASAYWLAYAWLYPSIVARELTRGDSATRVVTVTAGQLVGHVAFGWVARRIGRRPAFTLFATVMALGLVWLASLWTRLWPPAPVELVALGLVGVGTGRLSCFGALLAELFPTAVRATAMGSIFGLSRAAAFVLPVFIVARGARRGLDAGIVPAAVLAIVAALLVWTVPETDGTLLDGAAWAEAYGRPRRFRLHSAMFLAAVTALGLGLAFATGARGVFQPGRASDGHHLIVEACGSCHVSFGEVPNEKCLACHRAQMAENTHEPKMFDDPRWASTLATLDARRCVTCHGEHGLRERAAATGRAACIGCHEDVPTVRASHRGRGADSCARAGCHNYHDNVALTGAYLKKHLAEPELLPSPSLPERTQPAPLSRAPQPETVGSLPADPAIVARWQASAHAAASVGCPACHRDERGRVLVSLDDRSCRACHESEVSTFLTGKHGARVGVGLEPLRPRETRLPMKPASANQPREQGCATCHDPHSVDTRRAAVDACLACHDDEHSRAFPKTKHFTAGVTCATCHLPRMIVEAAGKKRVAVAHDNSFTLHPRDTMGTLVCAKCHGVPFVLSTLHDPVLAQNNFAGRPATRHETLSMIDALIAREAAREREK